MLQLVFTLRTSAAGEHYIILLRCTDAHPSAGAERDTLLSDGLRCPEHVLQAEPAELQVR